MLSLIGVQATIANYLVPANRPSSRGEALLVAGEERGQAQVGQPQQLHQQPLQPDGKTAVWRHPVAKRFQVRLEWLGGQVGLGQRRQVVGVHMQPLPASDQFRTAKQQVERVRIGGILRVGMGLERPFPHRIPHHK